MTQAIAEERAREFHAQAAAARRARQFRRSAHARRLMRLPLGGPGRALLAAARPLRGPGAA